MWKMVVDCWISNGSNFVWGAICLIIKFCPSHKFRDCVCPCFQAIVFFACPEPNEGIVAWQGRWRLLFSCPDSETLGPYHFTVMINILRNFTKMRFLTHSILCDKEHRLCICVQLYWQWKVGLSRGGGRYLVKLLVLSGAPAERSSRARHFLAFKPWKG